LEDRPELLDRLEVLDRLETRGRPAGSAVAPSARAEVCEAAELMARVAALRAQVELLTQEVAVTSPDPT
jgi:hypothetical protein